MNKLKAVFMGTPDFAVPCLEKLLSLCDIVAVVTQPDRPKGRGQKLQPSPVKQFAQAANLNILQPEKIKTAEFVEVLKGFKPDLIVVVAFGQILSNEILAIPPLGCVNVHASILPKYRGAAPIHWAIINGESISGVTTMFMDAGLDTGDAILTKSCNISQEMTTGELHDQLMIMGANLLEETVALLAVGAAPRYPQNSNESSYAPLLKKSTEKIDWSLAAAKIHDQVRGLNPWPGAYTTYNGQVMKIWQTKVVGSVASCSDKPGKICQITPQGFTVATGDGMLEIIEIQPASKRKMMAKDYVCGGKIITGDYLV